MYYDVTKTNPSGKSVTIEKKYGLTSSGYLAQRYSYRLYNRRDPISYGYFDKVLYDWLAEAVSIFTKVRKGFFIILLCLWLPCKSVCAGVCQQVQ
jgi:hypothetical protein